MVMPYLKMTQRKMMGIMKKLKVHKKHLLTKLNLKKEEVRNFKLKKKFCHI